MASRYVERARDPVAARLGEHELHRGKAFEHAAPDQEPQRTVREVHGLGRVDQHADRAVVAVVGVPLPPCMCTGISRSWHAAHIAVVARVVVGRKPLAGTVGMITPFIPLSRAHAISATVASRSCTVSIASAARRPGLSFAKSTASGRTRGCRRRAGRAAPTRRTRRTAHRCWGTTLRRPRPHRRAPRCAAAEFHSPSRALPVAAANSSAPSLENSERLSCVARARATCCAASTRSNSAYCSRYARLDVRPVVLRTPRRVPVARDDGRSLVAHGAPRCSAGAQVYER